MAGPSDSTPLLADSDHIDSHDEVESHPFEPSPAEAHLNRPIKILTIIIWFLSLSIFGLLIATDVLINKGPFQYTWTAKELVRHLAVCLFVNLIYCAATILLQIPIILNMAVNIAMLIVIFVFSDKTFGDGRTDSGFCLPETWECIQARHVIRIMMGISASFGIVIGLLLVTLLLLLLTALGRTRSWKGKGIGKSRRWNLAGPTVQSIPDVLPNERPPEYFAK